jgi:hypothetical protein
MSPSSTSTARLEGCTQPWCLLQDEAIGPEFVAELVVRLLSGRDLSDVVPRERVIERKERCLRCVLQVMRGRGPLATVEELMRLAEAAARSSRKERRARRRERREQHPRPVGTSFF